MKLNTSMRNTKVDAITAQLAGGTMKIYTGAQPASPNDAASGTLLCTINIPDPAFGAAAAAVASKSGVWSGLGVADGTAGWARLSNAASTKSFDISVGESGAEAIIDDANIVSGGSVVVNSYDLTGGE